MRVHLKGIHSAVAKLADGSKKTYWYAWRGGPRLPGTPGDVEFLAAYNQAIAQRVTPTDGVFSAVLTKYQRSDNFRQLAERTRHDYVKHIRTIEREFGDMPIAALDDKRTRGILLEWRDRIAETSRRQADYAWSVLSLVLAWGLDRTLVPANPCERGGRLYRASRVDKIWTAADESLFLARAPIRMHLPLHLALWTGQRQGDLLRLPWSSYDGKFIRLRQGKTGVRVTIPVGAPLKAALDVAAKTRTSPVILVNSTGKPWRPNGFRTSWGRACTAAGIVGLTFHDLRGTAVTRLAVAGCTEAEIATITGHSLRDVRSIIDSNYLHRDPALAVSAIRKLEESEQRTKSTK